MVLTVSFEPSPATGFLATVASRIASTKLDASVGASGPHDFAVCSDVFVWQRNQSHLTPPHPSHPAPNVP